MHCFGSCSKKCHGLEETKRLVEGKLATFFFSTPTIFFSLDLKRRTEEDRSSDSSDSDSVTPLSTPIFGFYRVLSTLKTPLTLILIAELFF